MCRRSCLRCRSSRRRCEPRSRRPASPEAREATRGNGNAAKCLDRDLRWKGKQNRSYWFEWSVQRSAELLVSPTRRSACRDGGVKEQYGVAKERRCDQGPVAAWLPRAVEPFARKGSVVAG